MMHYLHSTARQCIIESLHFLLKSKCYSNNKLPEEVSNLLYIAAFQVYLFSRKKINHKEHSREEKKLEHVKPLI